MGRAKLKSLISCFTPDGEYLSILAPNRTVKIWSTSKGSLLAELKQLDDNPDVVYSCMACSFVGKKRRKERGNCLLVLGTCDGDILAFNVLTGEKKWTSAGHHPGGVAGFCFANKGRSLYSVGKNGMTSEVTSETGELVREFKTSKKSISSLAFSADEKILVVAASRLHIFSLEDGKEIMKFSNDLGSVHHISVSDDAKTIVISGSGEKYLQVWRCDFNSRTVTSGPVLSMRHLPLSFECRNACNIEDVSVVTAVSESGVACMWHLNTNSEDEVNPIKVTVKANKDEINTKINDNMKKSHISILAARLHVLESAEQVTGLIAYGSLDSLQFSLLDISSPGENIVLTARKEMGTDGEKGDVSTQGPHDSELETAVTPAQKKKANKKRAASDLDVATTTDMADTGHGKIMDGDDLNEPTMGERLATLNVLDNGEIPNQEEQESSLAKPPSADSVHVLLKQALRADDRALLLDCLYTQNEKVIANSTSLLKPADVLKLLHCLVSIIQSRGAVVACALPWLRSLLLQHASRIMSQESSLVALNSIYQLIESRVSTFQPALGLSSYLDFLYGQAIDDVEDENAAMEPVIYEDRDESDEEGSEEAMETDEDEHEVVGEALIGEALDGLSDIDGNIDDMSD